MATRTERRRRFVVLPSRGIAGYAMEAAAFKDMSGTVLAREMEAKVGRFGPVKFVDVDDSSQEGSDIASPPTPRRITRFIGENDFKVLSQRFADGPAVVSMTPTARLAFEASNPEIRVVPITHYHVPGYGRRGATIASKPAAENASRPDGTVFADDAKQRALAAIDSGASGDGVQIGILDTGVDTAHPALQDPIALLRCLIPGADPSAGRPVDWGAGEREAAAHGTHVAGIIAAQPGFNGPAGVAPRAKLFCYRVFPDNPTGRKAAENSVIIDSIRAAIDDGCPIINLSLEGSALRDDGVRDAIADAWEQGVICIAAAGNGFGNPVSFPAALPRCIAVTAIGQEGAFPKTVDLLRFVSVDRASTEQSIFLARFSNFGPQVRFTAPGHAIVSTFPDGEWWFNSGTSMAAPFITGVLARLLSNNTNILNMMGDAERSAAMLQMLIGRARLLGLPQRFQEGFGLPS